MFAMASGGPREDDNTGVCEKTSLLREPLPCSRPAETALQPLKAYNPKGITLRRSVFHRQQHE